MRLAAVIAAVGVLAAALFVIGSRSGRAPVFAEGGAFTSIPTDTPRVTSTTSPSATRAATASTGEVAAGDAPAIDAPSLPPATPQSGRDASAPPVGTYTYDVTGHESVTGFGSRDFPKTLTLVAKAQSSSKRVFDITYSSQHEERQIVSYADTGPAFTYEAGSVSFFVTQNSETTYDPAITQVPFPLRLGVKRTGTSTAKNPNGSVSRVIDWSTEIVGRQTITVAGTPVDTWVVRVARQSRPGTNDQEHRTRTYWYDASRAIWVKWTEDMTASRKTGFGNFAYNNESTATLRSFKG